MSKQIFDVALSAMLFAHCSSADAQQTGKVSRIGFLDTSNASGSAVLVDAFRQELSKLGWIEGKNFTIECGLPRTKALSDSMSLRRTWFVLRLT
jgi:hypothetical protein